MPPLTSSFPASHAVRLFGMTTGAMTGSERWIRQEQMLACAPMLSCIPASTWLKLGRLSGVESGKLLAIPETREICNPGQASFESEIWVNGAGGRESNRDSLLGSKDVGGHVQIAKPPFRNSGRSPGVLSPRQRNSSTLESGLKLTLARNGALSSRQNSP